jgi:hypothetical protein
VTDTLPDPLVPAEVDLRDFPRMPFDIARLRRSKAWLIAKKNPELGFYMLNLWMASWHETPPGSLEDDDEVLMDRAMCKEARWPKVREIVLRNWVKCSDGRLYHETVAEMVDFAWMTKVDREEKNENKDSRQARWRARCKALGEQLRELGVTPPAGASLATLEALLRDTQVDARDGQASTGVSTVDKTEIALKRSSRQEKRRDSSKPSASSAAPTIPCPYDRIVGLYHEVLGSLPRVKLMPAARQKALRKVWGWVLSSTKSDGSRRATTSEEALDWLRGYFVRASENDFLMGRTPRNAEHANWQCDLDFLLTDKGMKQVIEKTLEHAA